MNLRCRKALSTNRGGFRSEPQDEVNESEMPKGVEHISDLKSLSVVAVVNESEMPKGVEHLVETDVMSIGSA